MGIPEKASNSQTTLSLNTLATKFYQFNLRHNKCLLFQQHAQTALLPAPVLSFHISSQILIDM